MDFSSSRQAGIADFPRAVLSAAVGVIDTVERVVVGEHRVRTARGNAWEAVCADRARADHRAEVRKRIATITMNPTLLPASAAAVAAPVASAPAPVATAPSVAASAPVAASAVPPQLVTAAAPEHALT